MLLDPGKDHLHRKRLATSPSYRQAQLMVEDQWIQRDGMEYHLLTAIHNLLSPVLPIERERTTNHPPETGRHRRSAGLLNPAALTSTFLPASIR